MTKFAVVLVLLLGACSPDESDGSDGSDNPPVSAQDWAYVFEDSSSRLLSITEGARTPEEMQAKCRDADEAIERDRPKLIAAADEELAERGRRWADAFEDFVEQCAAGASVEEREPELRKAQDAGGAAAARLAELGVQHAP